MLAWGAQTFTGNRKRVLVLAPGSGIWSYPVVVSGCGIWLWRLVVVSCCGIWLWYLVVVSGCAIGSCYLVCGIFGFVTQVVGVIQGVWK